MPQEPNPSQELDAALRDLEALAARPAPRPDRYLARALLVPLGLLVIEGSLEGLEPTLDRVARAAAKLGEPWTEAVVEELRLASAEYVLSVDPRSLDLPDYDFRYTVEARERLEARLVACDLLSIALPPELAGRVRAADEILEPYLEARDGRGHLPKG